MTSGSLLRCSARIVDAALQRSGASARKWCPHCLDESLAHGTPFMPLLWTIGMVTACPIHHCELETVCPHCSLGETPTGRSAKRFAMSAPGVCGSCGSWLGAYDAADATLPPRPSTPASDYEVSIAGQVAGLLAHPLQKGEEIAVGRTLTAAAQLYFKGSVVRLSEWLGLNKSTVHGWMKGTVLPELGRLADMAIKLRIPLRDLMVGNAQVLPEALCEKSANLSSYERSAPNPHEKRAGILALLDHDPGISVRAVARELGMNHRDIYHYQGQAVREHSEIGRDVVADIRGIDLSEVEQAVAKHRDDIVASGLVPGVRALREVAVRANPRLTYTDQQAVVHKVLAAGQALAGPGNDHL